MEEDAKDGVRLCDDDCCAVAVIFLFVVESSRVASVTETTETPDCFLRCDGLLLLFGTDSLVAIGFLPPSVSDADAFAMTKELLSKEGIICGISSGAAAHAALKVAARTESTGKLIVVILPDTGERYLSTTLFEN